MRVFDTKSGKSRPADAKTALKSRNECFVFSLPLFVKDSSTLHSNQVNIIHVVDSSTDSKASFFPGIMPQDLLKNKEA